MKKAEVLGSGRSGGILSLELRIVEAHTFEPRGYRQTVRTFGLCVLLPYFVRSTEELVCTQALLQVSTSISVYTY